MRTTQELLGRTNLKTAMIHLHTVPRVTIKETKSPMDF